MDLVDKKELYSLIIRLEPHALQFQEEYEHEER